MDGPVKTGYLLKKGALNKAWKKRFIKLQNGKLYYSESEEQNPKGDFSVNSIMVGPAYGIKHSHVFGIVMEKRTFYFRAESTAEMQDWFSSLASHGAIVVAKIGSYKNEGATHVYKQMTEADTNWSGVVWETDVIEVPPPIVIPDGDFRIIPSSPEKGDPTAPLAFLAAKAWDGWLLRASVDLFNSPRDMMIIQKPKNAPFTRRYELAIGNLPIHIPDSLSEDKLTAVTGGFVLNFAKEIAEGWRLSPATAYAKGQVFLFYRAVQDDSAPPFNPHYDVLLPDVEYLGTSVVAKNTTDMIGNYSTDFPLDSVLQKHFAQGGLRPISVARSHASISFQLHTTKDTAVFSFQVLLEKSKHGEKIRGSLCTIEVDGNKQTSSMLTVISSGDPINDYLEAANVMGTRGWLLQEVIQSPHISQGNYNMIIKRRLETKHYLMIFWRPDPTPS